DAPRDDALPEHAVRVVREPLGFLEPALEQQGLREQPFDRPGETRLAGAAQDLVAVATGTLGGGWIARQQLCLGLDLAEARLEEPRAQESEEVVCLSCEASRLVRVAEHRLEPDERAQRVGLDQPVALGLRE